LLAFVENFKNGVDFCRRMGWIKQYQQYFNLSNAKTKSSKLIFGFMMTLPHLITIVVLAFFSPQQWIAILIIGLLLPDFSYFFYLFLYPASLFRRNYTMQRVGDYRKAVSHILTFVVIIVFLLNREYILLISGSLHLLLDLIGF